MLRRYDVCVIGSGPAGLATALAASDRGQSVLIVEAGSKTPDVDPDKWPASELAHPEFHVSRDVGSCKGLGGTSSTWGGGCVSFEPHDVPADAWPISYDTLTRHRGEAAMLLGCGTEYDVDLPKGWAPIDGVSLTRVDRLSTRKEVAVSQSARLAAEDGPDILIEVEVTGFRTERDETGHLHIAGARFRDREGEICPKTLEADRFVITCGGLETTRLLLLLQRDHPELFGGTDGPLGRGYMGHLTGTIADVEFAQPADARQFGYNLSPDGDYVRRRLVATGDQASDGASTGFWIGNLPLWDANHRSAALSAKCLLAMTAKRLGLGPAAEQIDSAIGTGRPSVLRHVRNLGAQPVTAVTETFSVVRRYATGMPAPIDFLTPSRTGRYALRYHAEHVDAGDNRVTLVDGGPQAPAKLRIDFKFTETAADAVIAAHERIISALNSSGKMRVEMEPDRGALRARILRQALDGYHQIGTTRMGHTPETGVVDSDCRAFGLDNLFVASSSVFPTAAQANPTLAIVSLALRLGHHLADLAERGGAYTHEPRQQPAAAAMAS